MKLSEYKGQGHSLTLVKGHSDFKVKCWNILTFGLYTQVSDSGPLGPLVRGCNNQRLSSLGRPFSCSPGPVTDLC